MEEVARQRLVRILEEADRLGVPRETVVRLAETRCRRSKFTSTCHDLSSRRLPIVAIALFLIAIFVKIYPSTVTTAFSILAGKYQSSDKCTVWMPEVVTRALRPPVDCRMCRDVHSIDRVSQISPNDFEKTYAFSGRPVVITDATANWTAPLVFSFEFFQNLYAESTVQDNCQFFPYQTEFRSLWEVFEMSEERAKLTDGTDPWYIGWSNCDEKVGQVLRKHYDRPYFLPENSENKNTDWIFMGSPGYGAHLHVDNVNNPSWQAQLVGSKNWTLQPPPECIYECKGHQVTIYPGEIFVLDTNLWYHSTTIVSEGISITIGAEYD